MTMINPDSSSEFQAFEEDFEGQLEFELAADLLSQSVLNQSGVLVEKHELRPELNQNLNSDSSQETDQGVLEDVRQDRRESFTHEIWGSYSNEASALHRQQMVEDSSSVSVQSNQTSATQLQISLPAALCDETLLQEIQSIPDKMAFKIGDVADLVGIKQYVLRYWETEFDVLKPKKAANNQRMFTKKDVENVFLIRKLLHRDRFSIEGARAAMKDLKTFVRTEVKKEQELTKYHDKIDSATAKLESLIQDIRLTRQKY